MSVRTLVAVGVVGIAACTAREPSPPRPAPAPAQVDPALDPAMGRELYPKLREAPVVEIIDDPRGTRDPAATPPSSPRLASPAGWAEAYLADWGDGRTQVTVEFDGGACGRGGSVLWAPVADVHLRWSGPDVLEVAHPRGARFERNANGERLQCRSRFVREVLRPR